MRGVQGSPCTRPSTTSPCCLFHRCWRVCAPQRPACSGACRCRPTPAAGMHCASARAPILRRCRSPSPRMPRCGHVRCVADSVRKTCGSMAAWQHGGGRAAATLRPGPAYVQQVSAVLQLLRDVPLSYSLSGLEMTDDAAWLQTLLQTPATTPNGPRVEQRVLYSNGAGLACARSAVDGCAGCLRAVLDRAVASSSVAGAQRCDHAFSPRRADRRCAGLRADGTATGSTAAAAMGLPRAARWRGQRRRHCAVHRLRAQLWRQPGDLSRSVAAGRCLSQQRHTALHRRAPRWRGHLAGRAHAAALVVALATRWPDRR